MRDGFRGKLKKLFAVMLALTLLCASAAYADTTSDVEAVGVSGSYSELYEWETCSSYYFYNKLSAKEQSAWDEMYELCNYYLNTKKNYKTINIEGIKYGLLGNVDVSGCSFSAKEAGNFLTLFFVSNPQFYFLENIIYYSYSGSDVDDIYLISYNKFKNGEKRYKKTKKLVKLVKKLTKAAWKKDSLLEMEVYLHDKLCDLTEYDMTVEYITAYDDLEYYEQSSFTQSAYSALIGGSTVCSGYSQAFTLLCNATGIESLAVTSKTHAWNRVMINGYWYNVDVTWDDEESGGCIYDFFNRSSKKLTGSLDQDSMHKQEKFYKKYMKASICKKDSGAKGSDYGVVY